MAELAKEIENPVIDVEEITFKDVDDPPRTATQLPKPKGYKLLIALPEIEEKTDAGIIKSSKSMHEGDWVLFRAFSGTRIKIHGKEFRLINDDTVEAVVEDPRGVERA